MSTNKEIIGFFAIAMKSYRVEISDSTKAYPFCLLAQFGVNKPFQKKGVGSLLIEKTKEICAVRN